MNYKRMSGDEEFTLNGVSQEFKLIDFWRFQFPNIYDLQSKIAEFLVAKALGQRDAHNIDYWTLYDIEYQDDEKYQKPLRIEVKETSYYHPWSGDNVYSEHRSFGITKANSSYQAETEHPGEEHENKYERQNDIYVFCLNTGTTRADSYPLELANWEFYVIPTFIINEKCGDNKSITLNRVRKLAPCVGYAELKDTIVEVASKVREWQAHQEVSE